jgi:lysyl endopeptidase
VTSSQVQYNCDTEGGSSGSVVLAPPTSTTPTARAIGLHHLGGCPNSAAQMQLICNSAGALLRCQ